MKIDSKTKISDILGADKRSVDVISEINSHFKKLKNPIFRKLFAGRVTLADAAKVGGIKTTEILKKLESLGFEVDYDKIDQPELEKDGQPAIKAEKMVELDVRATLAGGIDPFDEIMQAISNMGSDKTLKIINTFEPIPLIRLLREKGFNSRVERVPPDLVITYFRKSSVNESLRPKAAKSTKTDEGFEMVYEKYCDKLVEIDVRHLEMPLPMVEILSSLENLPDGKALYVNHKRIPQFLLGELENRSYSLVSKVVDEVNTKLIIYRK